MTTEFLFSRLQQEKATGELTPLQKDFYSQAASFIDLLSKASPDAEKTKQLENASQLLASLKERRKQKLLLYIAYNKQLPTTIPGEEESLYGEIRQILNKNDARTRISRLKITSDIPEVLTTSGRKIGPYKQGEIIEISDSNEVDFILKNKIGDMVA